MRTSAAGRFELSLSAGSLIRLLIVSYFIASGLGIVEGTDFSILLSSISPGLWADTAAKAIVISLSLLILTKRLCRPAALLMALLVFWSSYVAMMEQPGGSHLSSFWRDLALIGALMLTYGHSSNELNIGFKTILGNGLGSAPAHGDQLSRDQNPERSVAAIAGHQQPSVRHPKRVKTEIYRTDFEAVRSS